MAGERLLKKKPPLRKGKPNPKAFDCLAHRCALHLRVSLHNAEGPQGSECGGCVMADVAALRVLLIQILEPYAARLRHHAILRTKLTQARDRLNLLSPGAGDWLDEDIREHEGASDGDHAT